jgi:tetratricopeptide (TPR) repeat protein
VLAKHVGLILISGVTSWGGVLVLDVGDQEGLISGVKAPDAKWMTNEEGIKAAPSGYPSIFENEPKKYQNIIESLAAGTVENELYIARDLYKDGDLKGALKIIDKLHTENPEHPAILIIKTSLLLDLDDLHGAVESARMATEFAPENIIPWSLLGTCWMRLNNPDRAEDAFWEVLRILPENIPAHRALGDIEFSRGRYDKGIHHYTVLLKRLPGHADVHYKLGLAFREKKEYPKAIGRLKHALALQPDDPEIYNDLGIALYHAGKKGEALEAFGKTLENEPGHFQALSNLGSLLAHDNQKEQAIQFWVRALEVKPTDAVTWRNLLLALDPGLAEDEAEELEVENSDDSISIAAAHYAMALKKMKSGKQAEANHYFIQALMHNLNHPEYFNGMGAALAALNYGPLASIFFRTSLLIDPDFESARQNLKSVRIAMLPPGQSDPELMAMELEERIDALANYPDDADRHYDVAVRSADVQGVKRALPYFQRAVSLSPTNEVYAAGLSRAYSLAGNPRKAVEAFAPIMKTGAKEPGNQHRMGWLLLQLEGSASDKKLYARALTMVQKASDSDPDNVSYKQTLVQALVKNGQPDAAMDCAVSALKLARAQQLEPQEAQLKEQISKLLE